MSMLSIDGRQLRIPAGPAKRCVARCSLMPPSWRRSALLPARAASSSRGARRIKPGGDPRFSERSQQQLWRVS